MTELMTSEQMRALENAAIELGEITGLALMERAGQAVVDATLAKWPEFAEGTHHALVLCGPGNNGGDGFAIARMLVVIGWTVDLFLYGDAATLPSDARSNYERWLAIGTVQVWHPDAIFSTPRPDVVFDAVFGLGLTRSLPEKVATVLDAKSARKWEQGARIRRVAVDCPSGLNLDNGQIYVEDARVHVDGDTWPAMSNIANLTVTFHTPKPGHYLGMGPGLCRELVVADIGLRGDAMERQIIGLPPEPERARLVEAKHFGTAGLMALRPNYWPGNVIAKTRGLGHKYDFGHVVVFAGGVGRGGAGRLAARAALRSGAGLVTVICPKSAVMENAIRLDAIMLRGLDDPTDLSHVADDRVTAFCVGPGLGVGDRTRALVFEVLSRRAAERSWRDPAVVLDADALTSFADDPEVLFAKVHERTILTPHEGEFARLFPDLALHERGARSKIDVARDAAKRAGCLILLKGADTVIASPNGGASVHAAQYDREVPWLATAGAGDVLAGLIAGLSASDAGPDLFSSAEAAVWLHVECARAFGPGLIAEDLPEQLPAVLRALKT